MTKYSTGDSDRGEDGGSCELCGAVTDSLQSATIAGASLSVCRDCAPHDDRGPASRQSQDDGGGSDRPDSGRRAAQQTAKFVDASRGDPSHWEEHGTNYEEDRLPYLVSGYGERLRTARQDAGLTIEELADAIDTPIADVEAVEQDRAARAGVGGSVISAIEQELDVTLAEGT